MSDLAVAALLVSLFAASISMLGLREARRANLLPTVVTLFDEARLDQT
jgi:hypothetical protein